MALNIKWNKSNKGIVSSKCGAFTITPTTYGTMKDSHAGYEMTTPLNTRFANTHTELKELAETMVSNAKCVLVLCGYKITNEN